MRYGSFFTDQDVSAAGKVCTVGVNVAENLFGAGVDPTGTDIRIKNHIFKIVGVMAPKGASSSGQNQDDQVFAPYTTVMRKLQGTENLQYIVIGAQSADAVRATADAAMAALRITHNLTDGMDDDVKAQTQDDIVALRTQATSTMTSLLAGVAAVSLLVGGIGIMNIMLVSVTERTREIGIRKALGATRFLILSQFLIEAVTLCLVGGTIGVALGAGTSTVLRNALHWSTSVGADSVAIAFGFSAAVGLLFGVWPARRAASLDPIESLRYE
jgi:putative ABC transport system permease protein